MKTLILSLFTLLIPCVASAQEVTTFQEPPDPDGLVNYCNEKSHADGRPWAGRPVSCVDMESVMIEGSYIDEWLTSFGYSFKYGFDDGGAWHVIMVGDFGKTRPCDNPWQTCFVLEKRDLMGDDLNLVLELANLELEQAIKDNHRVLSEILGI